MRGTRGAEHLDTVFYDDAGDHLSTAPLQTLLGLLGNYLLTRTIHSIPKPPLELSLTFRPLMSHHDWHIRPSLSDLCAPMRRLILAAKD